jgi:hypothetical protein
MDPPKVQHEIGWRGVTGGPDRAKRRRKITAPIECPPKAILTVTDLANTLLTTALETWG